MSDSQIDSILYDLVQFMHSSEPSDAEFNQLALRLFKYQFDHNLAYQRYCQHLGRTPRFVRQWQAIPAVPINAFKEASLSCIPPAQCQQIFMTSGTTRADVKGKNHHPNLDIYNLSMRLFFQKRFMKTAKKMHMGILFPTPKQLPHSSLAHYLQLALDHFGSTRSQNFISEQGLKEKELLETLSQVEQQQSPYALLGASYSFVHVFDLLEKEKRRFQLAPNSQLFDTGGFKGQSRELELNDFYEQMQFYFGVAPSQCTNMYGMTELSSQIYDSGNAQLPSVKSGPHWTRIRIIDPLTNLDVPKGEPGIIVHYDLANYNSVAALMTEDVGIQKPTGFQLLGRAEGADAKGCSLAMETFLQHHH